MNAPLTIMEITGRLDEAARGFTLYCSSLSDEQFFHQPPGKWSPAQQTKHLVAATRMAKLAFTLPKFLVRWIGGKPNRPSRTYEELVAKYKLKLEQGGRASGPYIPKPVPASYGRERLLQEFGNTMRSFAAALQKKWDETSLDHYLAPHPLLGKITLRELGYFTIHHSHHHLGSVRQLTSD